MQRVTVTAGRQAIRPIANALSNASSSTSNRAQVHVDAALGSATAAVSDDEDWVLEGGPFSPAEVEATLHDLNAVSHTRSRSQSSWSSSSDTSEDMHANQHLISADEHSNAMQSLHNIVANLLNDPEAGPVIRRSVENDPVYRNLVDQYRSPAAAALPPAGNPVLLLPGPAGWSPGSNNNNTNPLDGLLNIIVDMFAKLGNAIRRLPEDIAILLNGISGRTNATRIAGSSSRPSAEQQSSQFEAALMRVVTAVAVALIARRAVLRP